MTKDEMVGWYHQFNGHEFEQALGVGDGQGRLACCSPWDHKESDMTERLNRTELVKVKMAQLCPTLCDPMDHIVHGILQATTLE